MKQAEIHVLHSNRPPEMPRSDLWLRSQNERLRKRLGEMYDRLEIAQMQVELLSASNKILDELYLEATKRCEELEGK